MAGLSSFHVLVGEAALLVSPTDAFCGRIIALFGAISSRLMNVSREISYLQFINKFLWSAVQE